MTSPVKVELQTNGRNLHAVVSFHVADGPAQKARECYDAALAEAFAGAPKLPELQAYAHAQEQLRSLEASIRLVEQDLAAHLAGSGERVAAGKAGEQLARSLVVAQRKKEEFEARLAELQEAVSLLRPDVEAARALASKAVTRFADDAHARIHVVLTDHAKASREALEQTIAPLLEKVAESQKFSDLWVNRYQIQQQIDAALRG